MEFMPRKFVKEIASYKLHHDRGAYDSKPEKPESIANVEIRIQIMDTHKLYKPVSILVLQHVDII
jgi:hypothetical protein